ncbi:MAG: hypothetical protein ACK5O8_03385 [Pirellula sp.]|jgi:hypothetical protein
MACNTFIRSGFQGFGLPRPGLTLLCAAVLAVGSIFVGCTPESNSEKPTSGKSTGAKSGVDGKKTDKRSAAGLPPLKIALVEAPELESELSLRWQTVSDQGLQIVKMTRSELIAGDVSTLDGIIFQADFMGSLCDRGWIAPVPAQVLAKLNENAWAGKEKSNEDSAGGSSDPYASWPSRWRSLSNFGGKPMAIPLGAPSWIAITSGIDPQPLLDLHQAIISNQNTSEVSTGTWNDFLIRAEKVTLENRDANLAALNQSLASVSADQKKHLVDRFLWMLSFSESRYRGLFDLFKLQARINLPEFVRTAKNLHRLAVIEPKTILATPVEAWESVAAGSSRFAIGFPSTDGQQRLNRQDGAAKSAVLPLVWNGADGLVISMGRRTRQSASAADFLVWVASEDQRIALQPISARIELLESDHDRNLVREDYRDYQTMQRLESSHLSMELTPRFLRNDQYRELLGDALVDILRDPDQAEKRLAECKKAWDSLTDEIGKEKLRFSLESESGYSK